MQRIAPISALCSMKRMVSMGKQQGLAAYHDHWLLHWRSRVKQKTEHEILIGIKVIVMVGLVAALFLPDNHALVVNLISNMIWLWRT